MTEKFSDISDISDTYDVNALIVSQLSVERCRQYLSHLHALLYLLDEDRQEKTHACLKRSSLRLLCLLEDELTASELCINDSLVSVGL